MKYNEKEILQEIEDYIQGTYGQHYVGKNSFQIQDLLHSIDIAVPFCQANAIKYMARYGKKGGANRLDLLKAIHYSILLMHFSEDADKSEANVVPCFTLGDTALGDTANVVPFFTPENTKITVHDTFIGKEVEGRGYRFLAEDGKTVGEVMAEPLGRATACPPSEWRPVHEVVPTGYVPRPTKRGRKLQAEYTVEEDGPVNPGPTVPVVPDPTDRNVFKLTEEERSRLEERFWEDLKAFIDAESNDDKLKQVQDFLDKTLRKKG